jgi:hypothetical protein
MFPNAERLYDPETMAKFVDHLDLCKDCCEVLGTSQNIVGLGPQVPGSSSAPVPAIYIKPMQTGDYNFEVGYNQRLFSDMPIVLGVVAFLFH